MTSSTKLFLALRKYPGSGLSISIMPIKERIAVDTMPAQNDRGEYSVGGLLVTLALEDDRQGVAAEGEQGDRYTEEKDH